MCEQWHAYRVRERCELVRSAMSLGFNFGDILRCTHHNTAVWNYIHSRIHRDAIAVPRSDLFFQRVFITALKKLSVPSPKDGHIYASCNLVLSGN